MSLNWSTFFLEILNFIILVWILKRLFFLPILKTISERRQIIENSLNDANSTKSTALELKSKYESRLVEWAAERNEKLSGLAKELEEERIRRTALLEKQISNEVEKSRASEEKRLGVLVRSRSIEMSKQAMRFCAKLLERISSPELESRIIEVFLEDLQSLPKNKIPTVVEKEELSKAVIRTAFPLVKEVQDRIALELERFLGKSVELSFEEDKGLISGISLDLGTVRLSADLHDELQFFSEGITYG